MKAYIYESFENGHFVYYLYESNSRKNTSKHFSDWYKQVGCRGYVGKFDTESVYIDNPKNRDEQMITEVVDCRLREV